MSCRVSRCLERTPRRAPLLVWLLLFSAGVLVADDQVTVRGEAGESTVRRGEVVRYSARELQLRLPSGRIARLDADQVVSVRTTRTPAHAEAASAWGKGDDARAAELLREAYRSESRGWMRQEIVARLVVAMRNLGQTDKAAAAFLGLMEMEPETRFAHTIPLAWTPAEPDLALRRRMDAWVRPDQAPAARLIAASWLLSGARRGEARRLLETLARDETDWIRQLAAAQLWRADVVTSGADQPARWRAELRTFPASLQPAPSFVVAHAFARHKQEDAAVLAYLRAAWDPWVADDLREAAVREAKMLLTAAGHVEEASRLDDLPASARAFP